MKGGALFSEDLGIEEALSDFLGNCSFTILTNSSISCITLKCTIIRGRQSIIKTMHPGDRAPTPVNTLLLKIMPSRIDTSVVNSKDTGPRGTYHHIDITDYRTIEDEVYIQKDIYRKTILSPEYFFDGLCPSILASYIPCSRGLERFLLNDIFHTHWSAPVGKTIQDMLQQYREVVTPQSRDQHDLSVIIMEFMDDFKVAGDIYKDQRNSFTEDQSHAILYAFHNLHRCGYYHGDAHLGNIMINSKSPFFIDPTKPRVIKGGEIKIIDFGRSEPIDRVQLAQIRNGRAVAAQLLRDERITSSLSLMSPLRDDFVRRIYQQKRLEHAFYLVYQSGIYEIILSELGNNEGVIASQSPKENFIEKNDNLRNLYVYLCSKMRPNVLPRYYPIGAEDIRTELSRIPHPQMAPRQRYSSAANAAAVLASPPPRQLTSRPPPVPPPSSYVASRMPRFATAAAAATTAAAAATATTVAMPRRARSWK